jgi:hypothetical protein
MMAQPKTEGTTSSERSAKILAKSFYRQLRENGYTHNQVVSMASELISLVTQEMRERPIDTRSARA